MYRSLIRQEFLIGEYTELISMNFTMQKAYVEIQQWLKQKNDSWI